MADQLTPLEQLLQLLGNEWTLLERLTELVLELEIHLDQIRTDADLAQPQDVAAALAVWNELDEFGVDLNVPTLKTLLVAHAASHPTSDGSHPAEPISAEEAAPPALPLPSEQPSGETVTPRITPAALSDLLADEPPASPDSTEEHS